MLDKCPKCKVSWIGGKIPKKNWKYYSKPYVWYRQIGIYSLQQDRTVAYRCPDCKEEFAAELSKAKEGKA